jgi:hypothetical protein
MSWVLLVLGTVAAVEAFLRLPVMETVHGLLGTMNKVQRTIRSPRISDHWKERILLAYAARLFSASLRVFGLILLAILPLMLLSAFGAWVGIDLINRLTQLQGILVSVIVAGGYVYLRRRLRDV